MLGHCENNGVLAQEPRLKTCYIVGIRNNGVLFAYETRLKTCWGVREGCPSPHMRMYLASINNIITLATTQLCNTTTERVPKDLRQRCTSTLSRCTRQDKLNAELGGWAILDHSLSKIYAVRLVVACGSLYWSTYRRSSNGARQVIARGYWPRHCLWTSGRGYMRLAIIVIVPGMRHAPNTPNRNCHIKTFYMMKEVLQYSLACCWLFRPVWSSISGTFRWPQKVKMYHIITIRLIWLLYYYAVCHPTICSACKSQNMTN